MKVILCGANGAMGKLIDNIFGDEIVGRVSLDGENNVPKTFAELGEMASDVIVDFSHHSAVADVLAYAKEIGAAAVVGTTGHTGEEKAMIFAAAEEIPVFYAGNVSLGIAVLCRLVKQAVAFFPDAEIEIVEAHHIRKVDAPSGTAKSLGALVEEGMAITPDIVAVRAGEIPGIHSVNFEGVCDRLTFTHEAFSREGFARGAVEAALMTEGLEGVHEFNELFLAKI
jgi:4-hydroxy-tetrahydrodipicolinate reductase